MLKRLHQKFSVTDDLLLQVEELIAKHGKRVQINQQNGKFYNDPWINLYPNTPLGNVLDSLGTVGEARLLTLYAGDTYTAHTDPDDRYHYAITTNKYSYLVDVDNEKFYHLPIDGSVWFMDTSYTHIAVNWGPNIRTHLNVRVLLPHYDSNKHGLKLYISSEKTEWKQDSYIELMGFINKCVKSGIVTGFDSTDNRTLYLNTECPELFNDVFNRIRDRGVEIETTIFST